ncbi:hypothetical protein PIB30_066691 [Stylosanthes scabra]|uniref:Uncharacterized protein n=1 Tax=Stylosanthes scabra TaxID=79078 RepID=A0ABU6SNX9_9FABA|nr:hypothetical protein [Stylosanthes scabra]
MKDCLRSGPDDWSSRKYNRWLSGASSGSVGLGYDNRPGTDSSLESWRSNLEGFEVSNFSGDRVSRCVLGACGWSIGNEVKENNGLGLWDLSEMDDLRVVS